MISADFRGIQCFFYISQLQMVTVNNCFVTCTYGNQF